MFGDKDIIKLKRYLQTIIEKPLPFDKQKVERSGEHVWCKDWEVIELCKYIFNGHEAYMGDPPPNRLKNNPLWSKENIVEEAQAITKECWDNMDKIIESLRARRENHE